MNDEHLAILIECLEALEAGVSAEELLARFPAEAAQLALELRMAARLTAWGDETQRATPSAPGQARAAFLATAASMAPAAKPQLRLSWFLRSRLVLSLIALVVMLAAIGGGVLGASAASLPGDPLYAVKRSFENMQLSLVRDPVRRVNLEETFLNRRVQEIQALQSARRVTTVEFIGLVNAMEGEMWKINGFTVQVISATLVEGSPQVGDLVEVSGHTRTDGQIVADRIDSEGIDFAGVVEEMSVQAWVIGGKRVIVTPDTRITGTARVGARVEVHARVFPDGTRLALKIEFEDDSDLLLPGQPKATPNPGPTARPVATPTATLPSRQGDPAQKPEATRTPEPDETREPTRASDPTHPPEPTRAPEPTHAPEPSKATEPTRATAPTSAPDPSRTREPDHTPEPAHPPEPTKPPEPTELPRPTETQALKQMETPFPRKM